MLRVRVGDGVFLVDGTLHAAEDFVLIRGPPIAGGCDGDGSRLFLLRGRFFRRHGRWKESD
jgi:hypothetical protein